MAVVVELSGTNTLSDRLLCSRWVEPRASPLMVPYLLLFWQYFNSEQMLTQPRLIRLCTSDATLYFQSVCNAIFLDASDSFGSMYVVWVKHGTLVGVRGLGRNTPWLTFVWSLSDIYYLEPTSQPRTLSLEHAFFPQSPVWRIAVPIFPFYFYWQRQKCWSEAKRTVFSNQDDGGDQIRAKK